MVKRREFLLNTGGAAAALCALRGAASSKTGNAKSPAEYYSAMIYQ
jgi:hypothetical protein